MAYVKAGSWEEVRGGAWDYSSYIKVVKVKYFFIFTLCQLGEMIVAPLLRSSHLPLHILQNPALDYVGNNFVTMLRMIFYHLLSAIVNFVQHPMTFHLSSISQ